MVNKSREVLALGMGDYKGSFWVDENVLSLIGYRVTWIYAFVKTHQIIYLRFMNFIIYKFYLTSYTVMQIHNYI